MWMALLACGADDELLGDLDGTWSGEAAGRTMTAVFSFGEFLTGDAQVAEKGGSVDYGVRRAEAFNGVAAVDFQQAGGIQFLALEGGLDDSREMFTGEVVMTFECGKSQPCGYSGTYSLMRTGGSDTGSPPATP